MFSIPVTPSLKNVDLYLRLTLLPSNAIDSQLEFVARAFRHSNSGSALFTRFKLMGAWEEAHLAVAEGTLVAS